MIDKIKNIVPISEMEGEDTEETNELKSMFEEARQYLLSNKWCKRILEEYFGFGVGGVVGVFLFRIKPEKNEDEWLWVVSGDLPTAYFVTDHADNPKDALEVYIEIMKDWVDAIRKGGDLGEVYPVNAPADSEHADLLDARLKFLKENIIEEI